ncbi:MAG: 50S ribosomal protein L4, partial [Thermoprotei archaeon]
MASTVVYDLEGKVTGEVELPPVFDTPVRPDLIQRSFLASLTAKIQPQGRDPMAGKRTTAESWGVGYGIARVPRVKGGVRAALAPMTVGGRRA